MTWSGVPGIAHVPCPARIIGTRDTYSGFVNTLKQLVRKYAGDTRGTSLCPYAPYP